MKLLIPTTAVPERCIFFKHLLKTDIRVVLLVKSRADYHRLCNFFDFSNHPNFTFAIHGCPNEEPIERITWIRDWAERELIADGEWYAMADDKVLDIERYQRHLWEEDPAAMYDKWGSEAFRQATPPQDLFTLMYAIKTQCQLQGTIFGGVTCQLNPFYRLSPGRWHDRQTIPGPFMVTMKDPDIPWLAFGEDKPWIHKEDVVRTAFVLDKYGSVASDKWHAPLCPTSAVPNYHGTGTGTDEYRAPFIAATKKLLLDRFPGLMKFKEGDISMAVRWLR